MTNFQVFVVRYSAAEKQIQVNPLDDKGKPFGTAFTHDLPDDATPSPTALLTFGRYLFGGLAKSHIKYQCTIDGFAFLGVVLNDAYIAARCEQ